MGKSVKEIHNRARCRLLSTIIKGIVSGHLLCGGRVITGTTHDVCGQSSLEVFGKVSMC